MQTPLVHVCGLSGSAIFLLRSGSGRLCMSAMIEFWFVDAKMPRRFGRSIDAGRTAVSELVAGSLSRDGACDRVSGSRSCAVADLLDHPVVSSDECRGHPGQVTLGDGGDHRRHIERARPAGQAKHDQPAHRSLHR